MSKSTCISTATSGKTKQELINQAHEARHARELARKLDSASTKIQAFLKAVHVRQKLKKEACKELEEVIKLSTFPAHIAPIHFFRKLLFVCDPVKDRTILDALLQFIVNISLQSAETRALDVTASQKDVNLSENLFEESAQESIELSSEHIKSEARHDSPSANQNVQPHKPETFIGLVYSDITKSDTSPKEWINILEKILNLCLQYLRDHNSNRLDSQHIHNYLQIIDILTFDDDCLAESDHEADKVPSHFLKKVSRELLARSIKRNSFKHITTLVRDRIARLRNDLKSSVLKNYIRLAIRLLRFSSYPEQKELSNINSSNADQSAVILGMLCIPGLISYLTKYSKESITELNNNRIFRISMKLLVEQDLQKLTSTSSVCLLANFVHLAHLNEDVLIDETLTFVILMTKLLETCQKNMLTVSSALVSGNPRLSIPKVGNNKRKNESPDVSYNPLLGWLAREQVPTIDKDMIKSQLSHLWSLRFLKILLRDLVIVNERRAAINCQNTAQTSSPKHRNSIFSNKHPSNQSDTDPGRIAGLDSSQTSPIGIFRRVVERAATTMSKTVTSYAKTTGSSINSGTAKLMTPEASRISLVCFMLQMTLKTLTTLRQDILTGLCFHDFILPNLWTFICSLGPHNGLRAFLEYLTIYTKTSSPEFHILILFCECASHLISILDDTELYEKQQPFRLEDLVAISSFLNNFVFRIIWNNLIPINAQDMDPALQSTHKLLNYLYKRDCRRKFAPSDHWLIKDIKMSLFLKDLDASKPVAKTIMNMIPHVIPHKERVLIYRKLVAKDKLHHSTGPSTLITIHRSRIVEDGYQQLARLPPNALKGLIRVKFINDFGLDEAGIDQDGVFKEFLEDTIKRVFDPALNLFCSTSEQRLYPSPTSRLHEDYLSLFNFVGKMLGKAIYEGIVVDVPFATFFLNRVLGQHHSHLYSPIDELPSLDPELYKSLTYIKHYEGDVSELDLTFSIDQDFMGRIETHELESGGTSIPVTRESRVRYIHSVANFRMKTQIEKQTDAFVNGFKSIINIEWLTMFSASELQRLISGDNTPIDLQDLRRHTKYFGGFHNNHKVICWLWDILEKDFTAEEHRLFLKFVTSCSKPPLLGFANLEPPFSIRCVEVSDDQDLGDTLGSVLRGFLAMRQRDPVDRLPTSSTCFNLLKLPNYQRRSTLREKLRYAIKSNPGFELS